MEPGCLGVSADGKPRCPAHSARQERSRVKRRRQAAIGAGAQRRARGMLNVAARVCCARCCEWFAPEDIEVDHIRAIVDGGEDTDTNVQFLCIACHRHKTTDENARRRAARRSMTPTPPSDDPPHRSAIMDRDMRAGG